MFLIFCLIQVILIFLSVAFFTLFERKVMGSFHLRKGPNKVMLMGLIQPLLDAFKLLSKQWIVPNSANPNLYMIAPCASLTLSLLIWMTLPSLYLAWSMPLSALLFMMISSFLVIPNLISGWSSNSKYSLIGSLRGVAQTISYEAVMTTLMVILLVLTSGYSITTMKESWNLMILFFMPVWLICVLAEGHRAPFDFSEAESELVSGYNTEYAGVNFAFLFLAEYSVLLFSSMLTALVFFNQIHPVSLTLTGLSVAFLITWVRITFCRFRYDFLMNLAWKQLLPMLLFLLLIVLIFV